MYVPNYMLLPQFAVSGPFWSLNSSTISLIGHEITFLSSVYWNQINLHITIRVGGGERVFTPVRWRQVWLSCIKWRSTFFYIFSCVHHLVGSSSSGWTAAAPTVLLGWRFCPADTRRKNNVIMTLSPRRVPVGLASEAGRSPWCREFVGVTASSVWGRCWGVPGWGSCRRRSWSARFRFTRWMTSQ